MKKLLALVLALVMTLSLATVSTNAAFADADDISYDEAANVLSAVGVFVGDGVNFNPKAALNREQAAKLVAYLALGEDVAEALPALKMFDDVAADSWAAKYIAYCADAGIITGDGTGKFYPTAPVDGYAFSKMLLCALGYKAEAEGYTGDNWSINVATDAKAAGFNNGFNGKMANGLTREEAAQIMFNAIKAEYVSSYPQSGSSVTIGDVVVNQAWGAPTMSGISYYENQWDGVAGNDYLTLSDPAGKDDFGREANEWRFNGDVVSRVAKEEADFVITEKMTAKEVASLLKGYKLGDYKVAADVTYLGSSVPYTVNYDTTVADFDTGVSTAAAIAALTADGKLVELFANSSKVITAAIAINYEFGQVTDVTADSKGVKTYQFSGSAVGSYKNTEDTTQLVFAAEVAEDDYVTYVDLNDKLYVYPTTTFTGALTSYTNDNEYTIAGDAYKMSAATGADTDLSLTDNGKFWLDQYGFVAKAEGVTTTSTNYAYVLGVDADCSSSFGSFAPAAKVKVLLTDGTVGIYDVKFVKKTAGWYVADADSAVVGSPLSTTPATADSYIASLLTGNMYSYVISGSTIALKPMAAVDGSEGTGVSGMYSVDHASTYVAKNDTVINLAYDSGYDATLNTKTTYIFWDAEDEKATVVVGNGNLGGSKFLYDAATEVVVSMSDTGKATAKYVFVMGSYWNVSDSTDKYGYVDFSKYTASKDGDDNVRTYTMTLVDGSAIKVTEKNSFGAGAGLYEYNTDNTVGDAVVAHVFEDVCVSYADGVAKFNSGAAYTVAENFKLVDLSDDNNGLEDSYVIAVLDEDTDKVIEVAYIFDAPEGFVEGSVAHIGSEYYATLDLALAAATNGDTVELVADATLTPYYVSTKAFDIDGHGYTITPEGASAGADAALYLDYAGNSYTVRNVTFEGWESKNVILFYGAASGMVDNCIFQNNNLDTTQKLSGVVRGTNVGSFTVKNSKFLNNTCSDVLYAGIAGPGDTLVNFDTNWFEDNSCNGNAVIYVSNGSGGVIKNNTLKRNTVAVREADNSAVIFLRGESEFTADVQNNTLESNTVSAYTGSGRAAVLVIERGSATNNTFASNTVTGATNMADIIYRNAAGSSDTVDGVVVITGGSTDISGNGSATVLNIP